MDSGRNYVNKHKKCMFRHSVDRHTLLRSSVVYQRLSRSMQQHTRYHNIEVLVCFDAFGCVICCVHRFQLRHHPMLSTMQKSHSLFELHIQKR